MNKTVSLSTRRGPKKLIGTRVHKVKKGPGSYKRAKGKQLMKQMDENNKYRKFFNMLLEQEDASPAPEIPAADASPEEDEAALEKGLDPGTAPEDFDVKPVDIGVQSGIVNKIKEFITKIEDFSKFLNDEVGDSVNKFINEVDKEGSIVKGIASESSKVTTVAENLAGLAEAFKGKLLVGLRKHRENQASIQEF